MATAWWRFFRSSMVDNVSSSWASVLPYYTRCSKVKIKTKLTCFQKWLYFLIFHILDITEIHHLQFFRAPSKDSNSLPEQEQSVKCCSSNIFRKLAPLSFVLCVSWIGVISYLVTWMITIIGFTIGVPDTVMGLSFLAVGTSIPEVFSSLIVCRQGKVKKV